MLSALSEEAEKQGLALAADDKLTSWRGRVKSALTRSLGADHHITKSFDGVSYSPNVYYDGMPQGEYAATFLSGISTARGIIEAAIFDLEFQGDEEVTEESAPSARLSKHIQLHPKVESGCSSLYESGHYGEAVEKSFKIVRGRLRELTSYETGSEAFGKGSLYIKGANAPYVDRDFQAAIKFLTMSIDNFRNEKAHTTDSGVGTPGRAYEYLVLSSLAMHHLDNAEVRKAP